MNLAAYACDPTKTFGRLHDEKLELNENPFLIDRERIIHSMAFRRLEYKTQVFINHMGDHYRTRLTHSLEVSQIARRIARSLHLNEDLTEAIALCHDLGHPPFGHAGEDGLNKAAAQFGGFDHNLQTVKILTNLEQRYAEFDGLNLTWETIEGTIKHNGPVRSLLTVPTPMLAIVQARGLSLETYPSLEAQVASLSDDIAYCNHDIDDGIRAGMVTMDDLEGIPIIAEIYERMNAVYPNVSEPRKINEVIRRLISYMVTDLIEQSASNIRVFAVKNVDDVRNVKAPIIAFSPAVEQMKNKLKSILMTKVYRNYKVNRMSIKAEQVVSDLFNTLMAKNNCLPTEWYQKLKGLKEEKEQVQIIIDYISGMTDRYAIEEHKRLFNPEYF